MVGGLIMLVISAFMFVGFERIEGRERAVVQDWSRGILPELVTPGTKFFVPAMTTLYTYHIGTQKFIMGAQKVYGDAEQAQFPPYEITTGGSGKEQPAIFSVTLQFHLNPVHLINLHNTAQTLYRSNVIKPALTRIISDLATTQTVLDFYSGHGRVKLQKDIEVAITEHPSLSAVGIVVDTFVIDDIELDAAYVAEITGRQLATQQKLRAIEDADAAEEVAKKVEAIAKADKLKRIVEAEATKQERIKAAEADKQEKWLAAEASRFAKEQDAKGLLAEGLAQAQVDNARKTSRYAGQSGERQAAVEINQARVEMFKNFTFTGFIPEGAALTLLGPGMKAPVPVVNVSSNLKNKASHFDEE